MLYPSIALTDYFGPADQNGCVPWLGGQAKGRARVRYHGRSMHAAQAVWIFNNGDIPDGMEVCHTCDNPMCVNIDHLWLGTHTDNVLDMWRKGRGKAVRGERHRSAKLTEEQVLMIRSDPRPPRLVAADYNISTYTVGDIKARRTWRHLSPPPQPA